MAARPDRGFTLVEVMVALLVMALMAGMAWQGVDGIVRARDASQARLNRTLLLNTVLAQWEHDLTAVQQTPAVPALAFDGRTLRLTRRTDAGLQVVAWALQDPGNAAPGAGRTWQRWAGPPVTGRAALQEQWLASQQLQGNEAGQLRVASGVVSWQVQFYRGNAWTNAQSSGDVQVPPPAAGASAPAALRETLPSGVRLVLELQSGGGLSGALTRDIALGPNQP
jgi:general secretion pathway protein J